MCVCVFPPPNKTPSFVHTAYLNKKFFFSNSAFYFRSEVITKVINFVLILKHLTVKQMILTCAEGGEIEINISKNIYIFFKHNAAVRVHCWFKRDDPWILGLFHIIKILCAYWFKKSRACYRTWNRRNV